MVKWLVVSLAASATLLSASICLGEQKAEGRQEIFGGLKYGPDGKRTWTGVPEGAVPYLEAKDEELRRAFKNSQLGNMFGLVLRLEKEMPNTVVRRMADDIRSGESPVTDVNDLLARLERSGLSKTFTLSALNQSAGNRAYLTQEAIDTGRKIQWDLEVVPLMARLTPSFRASKEQKEMLMRGAMSDFLVRQGWQGYGNQMSPLEVYEACFGRLRLRKPVQQEPAARHPSPP